MDVIKQMLSQYGNQLSQLDIFCTDDFIFHFDEKDYYEISEIIKNRGSHMKLNIAVRCIVSKIVYSELDYSPNITNWTRRAKCIRLNMDSKWLIVSVIYEYDEMGALDQE